MDWTVRESNLGGVKIFCTRPDWPWDPPSLLYNVYPFSFPEVKWPGRGVPCPVQLGHNSVFGIATCYGLDSARIESRRCQDFLHSPRLTLGPAQPPLQCVSGLFPRSEVARTWCSMPHSVGPWQSVRYSHSPRTGRCENQILVLSRLSAPVQTDPGTRQASYTMCIGSLSQRWSSQGVMLTTHPYLALRLKKK